MKSAWLAQIGAFFSTLVAIACPLCIPALGAFLISIGLGIMVNFQVLYWTVVIFLVLAMVAFVWSATVHKKWWVIPVGLVGAALIYVGRYMWFSRALMIAGAVVLIGIAILNFRLRLTCERCNNLNSTKKK